jgi:hypothetical protein
MSNYNHLSARLTCPRCGREADMTVDLYFGLRDQLDYKFGDRYSWTNSPIVKNGGRPPDGNLEGEGYTECPLCKKDFFVAVKVDQDILKAARPDPSKKPLIPD